MDIQTFENKKTYVHAMRFDGSATSAMEMCKWIGGGSAYIPDTKTDPFRYVRVPTMVGPRNIEEGYWVVKIESGAFMPYREEALFAEYKQVLDTVVGVEESRLIKHARTELSMFPNEEPAFVESIIDTIKAFCSYEGHSGGSSSVAIHMVTALLNGQNLLPLTNEPEEWTFHAKETYGVEQDMWQNKRNSQAISYDGGVTYFLVNEESTDDGVKVYTSQDKDWTPDIEEEDLKSDEEKAEDLKSEDDKAAEEALEEVKRIFDEAEDKIVE